MKKKENFKLIHEKYATKIEFEAVNKDIKLKEKRMGEFESFLKKLEMQKIYSIVKKVNIISDDNETSFFLLTFDGVEVEEKFSISSNFFNEISKILKHKIEIFEKMLNKNFENWNIKQSHKNLGNVLQFSRKIKIRGKEYNPKISIINFEKIYSTLFLKKNINFHNLVHFLKDKRMLRLLNSNQLEIYMGNSAEEFEIAFIKNGKKNIPVKISFKNLYPKNYKKICSSIFKIREIEYENIGIFYGIFKYVCIVWPFLFIGSLMTKKNLFLITSTGILLLVSFVIRVMSYYSASNKILKIKTIDKK
jgi:hypothetical protein